MHVERARREAGWVSGWDQTVKSFLMYHGDRWNKGIGRQGWLLKEAGLKELLDKGAGKVTAKRIIHLINRKGVFERAEVQWIDYASKKFKMNIFKPE